MASRVSSWAASGAVGLSGRILFEVRDSFEKLLNCLFEFGARSLIGWLVNLTGYRGPGDLEPNLCLERWPEALETLIED